MRVSRRSFFRVLTSAGVASAAPFGSAAPGSTTVAAQESNLPPLTSDIVRISHNENPRGPGDAALKAFRDRATPAMGRYPDNVTELTKVIAGVYGAKPENVLLSTGSIGLLGAAVRAFASPTRALVNGSPSYWGPNGTAERLKYPVTSVPVDRDLKLDLAAMGKAAARAGLVFLCNPNNPTSTAHPRAAIESFVKTVRAQSPNTAILIDEAYLDFATDPAVGTAAPLALTHPKVFIVRTLSKAYGMAGLRLGYAVGQPATLAAIANAWGLGSVCAPAVAAAIASLKDPAHLDAEREENRRAREYTTDAFKQMGFAVAASQTNFVLVNIRRPAAAFRDACAAQGIQTGGGYPPLEQTHCRISIGTMAEMQRAVSVFRKVLGVTPTAA